MLHEVSQTVLSHDIGIGKRLVQIEKGSGWIQKRSASSSSLGHVQTPMLFTTAWGRACRRAYHEAKARHVPMTTLPTTLIRAAFPDEGMLDNAQPCRGVLC